MIDAIHLRPDSLASIRLDHCSSLSSTIGNLRPRSRLPSRGCTRMSTACCWFEQLIQVEHTTKETPLHALDRQVVDHLTSLWVPSMASLEAVRSPESLIRTVARLRAPGGCPWDREQTPGSLRNAVLEEAYEVVDAIDAGDNGGLAEELGDLLARRDAGTDRRGEWRIPRRGCVRGH